MQKFSSPLFDLSLVYALGLGKPGDEPCHLRKQADPVRDPEHFPERVLASAIQLRCVRAQQDWMWGCSKCSVSMDFNINISIQEGALLYVSDTLPKG